MTLIRIAIRAILLCFASTTASVAACDMAVDGYRLDWNGSYVSWANGDLTGRVLVPETRDPTSVTVDIAIEGDTDKAYQNTLPQVSSFFYDSSGPGNYSLAWAMDLDRNNQAVTFTIDFEREVENLSFPILDVDWLAASNKKGGFRDSIEITATNDVGAQILPSLSAAPNSTIYLGSSIQSNQAAGYGANAQNGSDEGNLDVSFTQPVRQVVIEYSNKLFPPSKFPAPQGIALGDLSFCAPQAAPLANVTAMKTQSLAFEVADQCSTLSALPDPDAKFAGPGACIEYVITAENSGSDIARALSLSDRLDTRMIFHAAALIGFQADGPGFGLSTPSSGQDCAAAACDIILSEARLDAGQSGKIIIRAELK